MYYYIKLHKMSSNKYIVLILSLLICKVNITNEIIGLSYKHFRRLINKMIRDRLIDKKLKVIAPYPKDYEIPYIKINSYHLQKYGLNKALYLACKINNMNIKTLLPISRTTLWRLNKELTKKSVIKEDKVVKVEEIRYKSQQKNISKLRAKTKLLTKNEIGWAFKTLCTEYGFKYIPPLKKDIEKVYQIQKTLAEHDSVSIVVLLERMIKYWRMLKGNKKSPIPNLGFLPVCYSELFTIEDTVIQNNQPKITIIKKNDAKKDIRNENVFKKEEELIDNYYQRMLEEWG